MKEVLEKSKCTGCTACYNSCPKQAIKMVIDNEGFKRPAIDTDKCVDCKKCQKVCPVINSEENKGNINCYVAYSKQKLIKESSSSGGIFDIIARKILRNNGIVIGAMFDENMNLNHMAIENENELDKLKGSKYLQSNLNDIFKYVKENIEDRQILFVGTPCQTAGLQFYLKKEYNNLYLIDLVCHGVPSPKLFEKYVKAIEERNNSKVMGYNFRDKKTGWETYSNTVTLQNGRKISTLQTDNPYMRIFLKDVALRESCYTCNFKVGNKYSDITLGDFWGVKQCYPEMYNVSGVSAVIVNTLKGQELFDSIEKKLIYKKCNLEEIIKGNPSLKYSGKLSSKRKRFFEDIDKYTIEELSEKYGKSSLKVCIKRKIKAILKKIFK